MQLTDIHAFFDKYPNFDRQAWLNLAKPCIDIEFVEDEPQADDSYFGGMAYVPKDFVYPTHEKGYYRFLGQINFAQLDDPSNQLPKTGLLSLFFAEDYNGDIFWGNDGYVLGYYWKDTTDFIAMAMPKEIVEFWKPVSNPPAKKVQFVTGLDLPLSSYLNVDYPADYDEVSDITWRSDELGCQNHLLGYPHNDSLGYDPTPKNFIPFLNLNSENDLHWCWHDGDKLMIFIEPEKLKQRDFSNLKTDAG